MCCTSIPTSDTICTSAASPAELLGISLKETEKEHSVGSLTILRSSGHWGREFQSLLQNEVHFRVSFYILCRHDTLASTYILSKVSNHKAIGFTVGH